MKKKKSKSSGLENAAAPDSTPAESEAAEGKKKKDKKLKKKRRSEDLDASNVAPADGEAAPDKKKAKIKAKKEKASAGGTLPALSCAQTKSSRRNQPRSMHHDCQADSNTSHHYSVCVSTVETDCACLRAGQEAHPNNVGKGTSEAWQQATRGPTGRAAVGDAQLASTGAQLLKHTYSEHPDVSSMSEQALSSFLSEREIVVEASPGAVSALKLLSCVQPTRLSAQLEGKSRNSERHARNEGSLLRRWLFLFIGLRVCRCTGQWRGVPAAHCRVCAVGASTRCAAVCERLQGALPDPSSGLASGAAGPGHDRHCSHWVRCAAMQ